MSVYLDKKNNVYLTMYKIKLNESLFKALDAINGTCVKNILKNIDKADKAFDKLFNKYDKFCKFSLKDTNDVDENIKYCTDCFKKFILEDLTYLEREKIKSDDLCNFTEHMYKKHIKE